MRLKYVAAAVLAAICLPAWPQDQATPQPAPPDSSQPASPPPGDQPAAPPADQAPGQPPAAPTVAVPEKQPEAPKPKDEAQTFDTIEVTAQRRRERLQDVPVAVTAMTQQQVESRGIGRLDDLNSLAPGLQVSRSPGDSTISQLTIRASSQINPAIYWDPAVGVYLDGVYIGKGQGSIFDIVDLAGVEVLRGPQGTLYGRNTIAGTINFVTREPSGDFNGHTSVEYGTYNDRVLKATMDLPRVSVADVTLGVRSERRDGWVTTTPTSPVPALDDRHNDGAHLGALLDIARNVTAMYHLDWSDTDQANSFLQLYRSTDATLSSQASHQRKDHADINAPSAELSTVTGHSLILAWTATDALTVKSITGYRDVKWDDKLDLDGTATDVAHSERRTTYDQLSQDLNLAGAWEGVHYTGGAYYFKDKGYTVNPIFVSLNNAPVFFDSQYGTHSKAWAVYGQADYQPLERLTLAAGARYTRENKELDRIFGFTSDPALGYVYYMPQSTGPQAHSPGVYHPPAATFTATTPMASVAWRFTDWLNAYTRYAAGFKSGGFNGEFSDIQGTPMENQQETNTPFRPEQQKSLEAGLKSSFLGGRALVNVAAFHNKLKDLQVSIFTASGAAASVIRNAGQATVEGIELETAIAPIEGTTLRANYAYLKPKYDVFNDAVCTGPNGTSCTDQNVADNRAFVHAPHSAYNLVADSDLWATHWGTLHVNVDYVWTASFYTYPYQLQTVDSSKQTAGNTLVPAYGMLNARLSFASIPLGGSKLGELILWGHNVLDADAPNNFIDFGPSFNNLTVANFVEPASFGLAGLLRW